MTTSTPRRSDAVIVTGAAGFIGSHVCEALLARGRRVIGIDNFDPFYDEATKRANLQGISRRNDSASFVFERADICDGDAMESLFSRHRSDAVIHLAARAGVRPSIEQPGLYARVNVEGTVRLLEAARRNGGGRFLLASSSSVYGDNKKVPFSEDDDVDQPISPYAATKRACELIAHTYHHLYRLPVACLRFFTVFGPRQRPDLAIGRFMRLISAGEAVPMFGDGASSRDYTYIDDIVAGVLAALDRLDQYGVRTWNLGGSHPVELAHMIEQVAKTVGKPARIDRRPMQAGDVERTYADLTRSRAELGYEPRTPFELGLLRQWEWMRST